MSFVELHCHSYYSFLDGASSPEELAYQAAELGMPALALTDRDGLYGAIPFVKACQEVGIQPIVGACLSLEGDDQVVVLCQGMEGYHRLSRLITAAYKGQEKGKPRFCQAMLASLVGHVLVLIGGKGSRLYRLSNEGKRREAAECLEEWKRLMGSSNLYVELNDHHEEGDAERCRCLARLAEEQGVEWIWSNAARYARKEQAILYDVLCCIRHHTTLEASHHQRQGNQQRGLKLLPQDTSTIAARCAIELDFTSYRLPSFEAPGGADAYLRHLCLERLPRVYPQLTEEHRHKLDHELALIKKLNLAGYFLVVWDIVEYARGLGVPCQGRGSAANSLVAYVLGITPVDPIRYKLFLGRFINEDMVKIPDIDLDFASSRDPGQPDREDVIRYVYERYGEEHVAMVCTFVTYKGRSAVREVGKVFGLPEEQLDKVAKLAARYGDTGSLLEELSKTEEFRGWLSNPLWRHCLNVVEMIGDLPRHLGIHVGGMLIASRPISELVPLEPARMEGRLVCQWDKDMVEDAGLIKVDILGLGMLAVLREGERLAEESLDQPLGLFQIALDDPAVYQGIASADTVGLFQVESRAQMQSLPRTQPRHFEELGIQVAIIRPGPLQGNMVDPYIARRQGRQAVSYPHSSLEPVLKDTLGVILFQEQVLQVAVTIAGFSPGQADSLRRAMSRRRSRGAMEKLEQAFMEGALANGVSHEVASQVFRTLEGFALYGFCKSHALAFAKLAYLSAWLKRYHPAAFYAALLNNQPMGFYPEATLLQDARRHGVEVLPVDVNASRARCHVENEALRLGLITVKGLKEEWLYTFEREKPFRSLRDFRRRVAISGREQEKLVQAGAFDSFGLERRELLWQLWMDEKEGADELPLGWSAPPLLPVEGDWERLVNEYRAMGFSPHTHPMAMLRGHCQRQGWLDARRLRQARTGERVCVAGVVVCRQRPPTAKGFAFLTVEDEFDLMNVVVPPAVYERCRVHFRHASLLMALGTVDSRDGVINVKAIDLSSLDLLCIPIETEDSDRYNKNKVDNSE